MSERFVEAFVDKLILLEQKTGASVQYRVMQPFTAPFHDHLSIQGTAKDIAEFIGLTGYTFIVAIAKQKEKVGGHIDLSTEGTSVFVEIDPEMMKFPDSVGATLCHEICHKWLQSNGIRSAIEIDNEILTDITSVFLGFGKIMLNGCRTENVRYETIPNGTRTITEAMTAGYLDRDQLAFVYNLVCAMRKIPSSDFMQGLNAEATHAFRTCNSSYGHHYSPNFHQREDSRRSIDGFKGEVTQTQYIMADLDKHLTYVRRSFCETVNAFLKAEHKKIGTLLQNAVAMINETTADPALRFLQAIKFEFEIDRLSEKVRSISQEADGFLKHARQISRHLSRNGHSFPPPSSAMFNIVVCPQDGTKLRLPENSGDLIATCPKCKYRFAYNTSAVSFSESPAPRKITWWQKVRNLMRRKKSG
jgi:hypothetical protein|tara:strand:- start:125 stop:1375 length:1251 start_codon:yes stop_codon:yes gene_type:complete